MKTQTTLMFLALVAPTFGATEMARNSLRGLTGVQVLVEPLSQEVERDGLTRLAIQTVLELELRRHGVKVLTEEEGAESPGSPYLYVNVNTILREGVYAYSIRVDLMQKVYLPHSKQSLFASTWSTGWVGIAGRHKLGTLKEVAIEHVDEFINDFLAVNPKERKK